MRLRSILFFAACAATLLVTLGLLTVVLGAIVLRGIAAINLGFLIRPAEGFGQGGGIFYQIVGTVILIFAAAALSLPLALGAAIYQTQYLSPSRQRLANTFIYGLNGVPTIIFGLFGYIFFGVFLRMGVSWVSGAFILGLMILPTLVASIKEAIESIPASYRETALSLGFSPGALVKAVIIPYSRAGIITGLLLGLSRAAGETAAIMFTATAFSGARIPRTFFEPVATLQTHILVLSQAGLDPRATLNAWGAALVLVGLVFIIGLASAFIRRRANF
ncbi:MAG: PstA family ABC transporter permease [Candidatus Omnitrophota bacterium]